MLPGPKFFLHYNPLIILFQYIDNFSYFQFMCLAQQNTWLITFISYPFFKKNVFNIFLCSWYIVFLFLKRFFLRISLLFVNFWKCNVEFKSSKNRLFLKLLLFVNLYLILTLFNINSYCINLIHLLII